MPSRVQKPNSRLAAPLKLSAEVTVTAGRSAIADTGRLSTKFRRPFWVDDVTWSVEAGPQATASVSFAMQTRLRLGRFALSDRFIPIQNYAPLLNYTSEQSQGDPAHAFLYARWKLPKPLFVPSGMTLVSEFFRPLGKLPSTATVNVAYGCRYMPTEQPTPKDIDVPWVTMFAPQTDAVFAQSSELDLYNPFDKPLEVQRFLFANQDSTINRDGSTYLVNQNLVTVMKDSHGTNVIRDFSPTGEVFDINRRSWTFNKVLAAKERYNITLQALSGSLNNYFISMVGSRKEAM